MNRLNQYTKFLLSALIGSIIFSACSTTKQYHTVPEYQENKEITSLTIVPIKKDWFPNSTDHPFGYLSPKQDQAFYALLEPLFSEKVIGTVNNFDESRSFDDSEFKYETFQVGESQFKSFVPNKPDFGNLKQNNRFIVFLDQYYFRKRKESARSSNFAGAEVDEKNYLFFETKFVIWDTLKNQSVSWGTSNATTQINGQLNLNIYSQVLDKAIDNIVKWGPVKANI